MMDIKMFTYGGGGSEGVTHSQKWENQYPYYNKISNNFYFDIFFLRSIFKIFLTGEGGPGWVGEGIFF